MDVHDARGILVGVVVRAGCVVVCLVRLVVQLLLHVRVDQIQVVDVVDLDLRGERSSVTQYDGAASCSSRT